MRTAFGGAKPLDICFLYCCSHGSKTGLGLFVDSGSDYYLTPSYLRSQVDSYNGTFVVFISGCNSGTYITKGINEAGEFNAEEFVDALTIAIEDGEMVGGNRLKVLCSSEKSENSFETIKYATNFWCLGSGYNLQTDTYGALLADTNRDNRISLNELYNYSAANVSAALPQGYTQNVVCSPANDNSIIFERTW